MDNLNSKKLKTAVKYINSWLDINFKNSPKFPGMQVAILHQDKIVYSKAFGFSSLENQTKMTTESTFRIASHSKTFTSTAIMQLYEAEKLSLDDKVSKHLNWFKSSKDERVANITIRQLLNHTSGLARDGDNSDYWQLLCDFPDEDYLKNYVSKCELFYDSDERFKYSNFGYGYLGLLIKAVSGLAYRDYMERNIIEKLGLKSTQPDLIDAAANTLVDGYDWGPFGKKQKPYANMDTHALSSATGFCSNAEDLCRFFAVHFYGNNVLINDYSKRIMQHGSWKTNHDDCYGLGMDDVEKNGWKLYGHGGSLCGFKTNTRFDPKKQLVVSVMFNTDSVDAREICSGIIDLVDSFQQDNYCSNKELAKLKKFEGRFYSNEGGLVDIICVGGKLLAFDPLWWNNLNRAERLVVKDDKTLRIEQAVGYGSPGEDIRYSFDTAGRAEKIKYAGYTMSSKTITSNGLTS